MIPEECHGCTTYNLFKADLHEMPMCKFKAFECPCVKCIVKSMCIRPCKEYFDNLFPGEKIKT